MLCASELPRLQRKRHSNHEQARTFRRHVLRRMHGRLAVSKRRYLIRTLLMLRMSIYIICSSSTQTAWSRLAAGKAEATTQHIPQCSKGASQPFGQRAQPSPMQVKVTFVPARPTWPKNLQEHAFCFARKVYLDKTKSQNKGVSRCVWGAWIAMRSWLGEAEPEVQTEGLQMAEYQTKSSPTKSPVACCRSRSVGHMTCACPLSTTARGATSCLTHAENLVRPQRRVTVVGASPPAKLAYRQGRGWLLQPARPAGLEHSSSWLLAQSSVTFSFGNDPKSGLSRSAWAHRSIGCPCLACREAENKGNNERILQTDVPTTLLSMLVAHVYRPELSCRSKSLYKPPSSFSGLSFS